jgi:recombinational DNA repair protein RecR
MENNDLKNNISKVLNANVIEDSKTCKSCGKGNSTEEKKCRSCNQVKKKLTPYILISVGVFMFMVYGIYKAAVEIISSFTQ